MKREKISIRPEELHEWYLESTKQIKPKSYNPEAQKSFDDLTEDQKFIDDYIAKKVNDRIFKAKKQGVSEGILKASDTFDDLIEESEEIERSLCDNMQEQSKKVILGKLEKDGTIRLENYNCVTEHDKQHIAQICERKRFIRSLLKARLKLMETQS